MGFIHVSQERGIVAVTVAILLAGLLAFGALALDVSTLFVVRNELQNAADAGALAATRVLYLANGTQVNSGANAVGIAAAMANDAQGSQVELIADPAANTGDVQRGHWRWSDHTFTPNDSLAPVSLSNVSNAEIDANLNFINAVRVRVRRQAVPARSFLSKVMGFSDFQMQAEATAYMGFAGSLLETEADQPIALCEQSLLNSEGKYSCSTGRMINSNSGGDTFNTGGWTNFIQDPCATASTPTVRPYVGCAPTQTSPQLEFGEDMGTTGGQVQTVWDDFWDCWQASYDLIADPSDGRPDTVKNMTLPVIDCPGSNVAPCSKLVGAVNVNMLWMIRQTDPNYDWVPLAMDGDGDGMIDPMSILDWSCPAGTNPNTLTDADFLACWADFTTTFNLKNYLGTDVGTLALSDLNKTMFFRPDCTEHPGTGGTGGKNFGILAKLPVLVK